MNTKKPADKHLGISDANLAKAAAVAGVAGTAMEVGAIHNAHKQAAVAIKKVNSSILGFGKNAALQELKAAKRGRLLGGLGLALGGIELMAARRMHNNATKGKK